MVGIKLTAREKDVKKSLKEYLKAIGAYQYWPVPMGYGSTSVDVFFCYQGLFFAVETKRSGVNEPTDRQHNVLCDVASLPRNAGLAPECPSSHGGTCLENDPALPAVFKMISDALESRGESVVGQKGLRSALLG
jgi:hypothetical protein